MVILNIWFYFSFHEVAKHSQTPQRARAMISNKRHGPLARSCHWKGGGYANSQSLSEELLLRCLFISQTCCLIPWRTSALMEMAGVRCLIDAVCLSLLKMMHNINICTGKACWNPSYYAFWSVVIMERFCLGFSRIDCFWSWWLKWNNVGISAFDRHFNLLRLLIYTWFNQYVLSMGSNHDLVVNAILHLTQLSNRSSGYIIKQ